MTMALSINAPPPLVVRRAVASDIADIMSLEVAGFEPHIREAAPIFEERMSVFPAGFMVAEDDSGALIAYLCSERWTRRDALSAEDFKVGHSARERHDGNGGVLYISSMTVSPSQRGKGLGARLFSSAIDAITGSQHGIEQNLLMVNESWLHARRIYASCGYVEILRFAAFFGAVSQPSQDALILFKGGKRAGV